MEDKCAFCDANQFKERIVGEDDHFYIVATLGQISDGGYLILIPKRHIPCLGAIAESEIPYLKSAIMKIVSALYAEYGITPGVVFEHGIVGQTVKHAHLHFIPLALNITGRIMKDFPDSLIVAVKSWQHLAKLYAENKRPYLFWMDYGEGAKLCLDPPAPPAYLRIVVAEAIGRPKRANWRTMDTKLDKQLIAETVARFKKYFL